MKTGKDAGLDVSLYSDEIGASNQRKESMKASTLRGIPPDIGKNLRRSAEKRGISLNKAAIALFASLRGAF